MDMIEIRLECLKLACEIVRNDGGVAAKVAEEFEAFVTGASVDQAPERRLDNRAAARP